LKKLQKGVYIKNEGESAASFCRQVAAWVPDMFCNFYLVKNLKIANNSATTVAREKNAQIWNPLNFRNFLMYVYLNLRAIKFYLIELDADFY
jgi:hypothetical protein